MSNTLKSKKPQIGGPLGLGSKTEKQGLRMNGAEAIIASLEAEGVDLVFGYPGGQAIEDSTTRSTTASRSRISSLVTSRVRFTRPTAMRVRRGVLAWPSSRLALVPRTR